MNFFRELVSGQKVRFNNGEYNLDLTYITNRVIAMSFPASGLESTFRNDINDVARFLWEYHGDQYMIFNLSNRKYNYEKFGGGDKVSPYVTLPHIDPRVCLGGPPFAPDRHAVRCLPQGGRLPA